ncbi:MAG TPA: energy transducer TonB, partial [Longimicrobiaceae bacterium]|nr:energy transducer TonB [Longimicrobiaceae bacterium]
GRVSLVPPGEPLEELTTIEIGRVNQRGERPVLMYAGDSASVTVSLSAGAADVDAASFRDAWVRDLDRGTPNVLWKSRDVVEMGGARWLKLVFAFPRRVGSEMREVDEELYLTPFQGRTLTVAFAGPPRLVPVLAQSAATLEVHDCRVLRPMSAWLDSAGLATAAAALPAPRLPEGMKPLFRVVFDTAGAVQMVEPVYDQVPAEYAAAAVAAIRANLKPQPHWRTSTWHLVRVSGGPAPRVDDPEVVERAAVLQDRDWVSRELGQLSRSLVFRPGATRQVAPGIYVRLRVRADGRVDRESVQLERASGVERIDRAVLGIARAMTFEPGQVDGIRAVTWIVVPMGV